MTQKDLARNALFQKNESTQTSAEQRTLKEAQDAFDTGNVDQALDILKAAEEQWPDSLQIPYLTGKYLADKKSLSGGIAKLREVLKRNPDFVLCLLELGNIHVKHGDPVRGNPYIQRALEIAPMDPAVHGSMGVLQQRIGNLPEAVEHFRTGLQLHLKRSTSTVEITKKKADFRIHDAEDLLWKTLSLTAKNGIHMFAISGTLLGLVRNGHLLAHDKDLDVGVPFSELNRAVALLKNNGWIEVYGSFGLMNPRALVNKGAGISVDVSGFTIDADTGKAITGTWMPGLPKEWNQIYDFDHIELERRETPDGTSRVWQLKAPETWLEAIYGDWRVPDKTFDTIVAGKNIRGFSLLTQCYAYSRILTNWSEGNLRRARALVRHTLARAPQDALIRKVSTQLGR
jgi:tetratricopeptide (TPR) repeat protein